MRLNRQLLLSVFLFMPVVLLSQTKEELKTKKIEIEKEIRYTTELLNKTKSNKTKSLNYLKALQLQIKNKEALLITLNIEIHLFNKQINRTEISIIQNQESIEKEHQKLKDLKNEYARMLYATAKQKGGRNSMMFIVSSADFNQAYKRIIYLKQYSVFRKKQANKIQKIQLDLIKKKKELAQQKQMQDHDLALKKSLVDSKKKELANVSSTKKQKKLLVEKLSKSEKLFKKQLQEKTYIAQDLDNKIRKIIEEEIRKSRQEAKRKGLNDSYKLTPEALAISSGFKNNRGGLPWPLEKGIIVNRYGRQKHSVFSGIETFNNGVDIATDKDAEVRTIFDGVVSRIFFIKGEGKAILINHGEYFSVYSGLKEVTVKAGEKLLSKEIIGVVRTHEEGNKTELHFEIWQGYEKHDPADWLYKAY